MFIPKEMLGRVFAERAGNARLASICIAERGSLGYSVPCTAESKIPEIGLGGFRRERSKSCKYNKIQSAAGGKKFCWQMVCYTQREPRNGSWRICEKVSVSTISRRPGDRTWNDLLGQRAECSIDTIHHVTGCDAVAANAIDAAASVSGNAAFGAADAEFAEWLAIARRDRAEQPGAVIAERISVARRDHTTHADAVAERITVANSGHDRS